MTTTTERSFEEITSDTDRMLREMAETERSWAESTPASPPHNPLDLASAGRGRARARLETRLKF